MGTIVFVRHGQASMGAADYDRLSALGEAQAVALGEYWARAGISADAVFTGPARRHIGTEAGVAAAMARADLPWPAPKVLPGFDEHDAFALVRAARAAYADTPNMIALAARLAKAKTAEDRNAGFQRIFEVAVRRWISGELAPDGLEPWTAFHERVNGALDRVRSDVAGGRTAVVFSSVGPSAVLLARALGTAPVSAFETAWRLRNSGVCRFVSSAERFTLDGYNDLSHLEDPHTHTFR